MPQSLQLGVSADDDRNRTMRRVNRLPIIIVIAIVILCLGVIIAGLSWRGLSFGKRGDVDGGRSAPATSFGEQLKRGIGDGIIGEPERQEIFQPAPVVQKDVERQSPSQPDEILEERPVRHRTDDDWQARLKREQEEQYLREIQRQKMARLQARETALDSPMQIALDDIVDNQAGGRRERNTSITPEASASDLYATAIQSGLLGQNADPNGQGAKEDFFNRDIREVGYLPTGVVPQMSQFELKRGSIIPATMITGLNSDLPGRITAQVSQNVFDSATGQRLLIPQGAKLFGRYDSKVSFGQDRALVVWTDLIFPNGATLQIGAMAGTDSEGYGGFSDKVDRHLWRTFGSAALVAVIGTGIDMSIPESSTLATQDTASDSARRNFAETFGRVAEQTVSKHLNVQPTIRIRPGYKFNVLVDQDIIFPGTYKG
jgi:type IV secretion system protein TrbI